MLPLWGCHVLVLMINDGEHLVCSRYLQDLDEMTTQIFGPFFQVNFLLKRLSFLIDSS